jgi:Flp pilus assembly protein TadG
VNKAQWLTKAGGLREFVAARDAATAGEFALIGAPLFALLFAMMETALVFFAQQTLQTATTQSARLIMTGQAQSQSMTPQQFQQAVCGNDFALFTCSSIYVNVQTFASFTAVTPLSPVSNGNFNASSLGYNPGGPGDVVLVQVFYQWPVIPAPLGFNLSNANGGARLLVGNAAFRNEPY